MQQIHSLFVYEEELKGGIQGYNVFTLFNYQPTKVSTHSSDNVRTHLLRQNLSRDYSSIRSGPVSLVLVQWKDI